MVRSSRAHVVSSFTLVKGAMIPETYSVFAAWDLARTKRANLQRLREQNFIGARSETWLRDVAKVINRRFDPDGRDRPLVLLAKNECELEVWKPILLWHMTRDEFLLRDFLTSWLFPIFESGTYRVRPESLHEYLRTIAKRGGSTEHAWSENTVARVAAGLLKIAVDFELLRGSVVKEFASYHLPDASFLYLLHAVRDATPNPRKIIESPEWRMFLMSPGDVERELLRLHQFKRLDYHVAGSLAELSLPCTSPREFAEKMMSAS
ncbi:MAG TPA: BrxA family protein [Polyangia bacterium]|nr:BrxA family protein [Polyangia bacterium]